MQYAPVWILCNMHPSFIHVQNAPVFLSCTRRTNLSFMWKMHQSKSHIHIDISFMCNTHRSYIHVQYTSTLYSCAIHTMFIFWIIHPILCQLLNTIHLFWFSQGNTPHFSFVSSIRLSPRSHFFIFLKETYFIGVLHFIILSLSFNHQLKSKRAPENDPQTAKRASRSMSKIMHRESQRSRQNPKKPHQVGIF